MHSGLLWISVFFALLCSSSLYAESDPRTQYDSARTLPDIMVLDTSATNTPGTSIIDRKAIDIIPHTDGNVTDILRILPGIQFSESERSSLTGGEILPAEISISGGRVYENNFLIDGQGNNSLLDPMADNPMSVTDVPGHSQEMYIDTSLVDSVTVQRSNISARYGGFTGGVVEMETRDPSREFQFQLGGRTTRSEWASFHVSENDEDEFQSTENYNKQSEFRKYSGHMNMDIPINDTMGILLAYSNSYSEIPLSILGNDEQQHRISENYLFKYQFLPSADTSLMISALYNPYEAEYLILNTRNSDFTVEGGGVSFNLDFKHKVAFGEFEFLGAWRQSRNDREAPNGFYAWDSSIDSTSWGEGYSSLSQEGGYGDIENSQDTSTVAIHFESHPVKSFNWMTHRFNSGLTYEKTTADYSRTDDVVMSRWVANDAVVCLKDAPYCRDGEQFAYALNVYNAEKTDAEVTFYDFYFEDIIELGKLTLRPGVHFGYNDLMKNHDYAFRNALFYDIFANGKSVFNAGFNRYYGKTFLTYALLEGRSGSELWKRSQYREKVDTDGDGEADTWDYVIKLQEDGTPEPWDIRSLSYREGVLSRLDTPYVDEWSVGLEQEIFGGVLTVNYLHRNGEDSLVYNDEEDASGNRIRVLTNAGDSRHEEISLSWEVTWSNNHSLLINGTWQRSFTTNESYSDLDAEEIDEIVSYRGQQKFLSDLPRSDYNREWRANLVYHIKFGHGFSFTNVTEYRSGYTAILDTGDNLSSEDGERFDIYADVSRPSATTFDWKLAWKYDLAGAGDMTLSAEVYNVFNRKLYTGLDGEYEMGRQLWVGVDYSF
jgi:hypothetical protein